MDGYNWTLIIIGTTVGFFLLATVLLLPVYRFIRREEDVAEGWTPEALARRQREDAGGRRAKAPPGTRSPAASGEDPRPVGRG